MDGNLSMANQIVNQTEEQANTPNYPKGTTKEQWDSYYLELERHTNFYERKRPMRNGFNTEEEFNSAYSKWQMDYACFEPNKPGYYRANND